MKLKDNEGALLLDPSQYRQLTGKLLYLTFTKPDLAYTAQVLSQFMQSPRVPHYQAIVRVLRYIKAIPSFGLFFPSNNPLLLKSYCDND